MHLPFVIPNNSKPTWALRPEWQKAIAQVFLESQEIQLQATKDESVSAEDDTYSLDETTRDAVIKQRIGQGKLREYLSTYWQDCSVTGCNHIEILIASHIKPWHDSNDEERLDKFNGLLLIPNLDKCIDNGLISFEDNGSIIISDKLISDTRSSLGITPNLSLQKIDPQHQKYLRYHRDKIFHAK